MTRVFLFAVCTVAGLVCASCDEKLSSITGPTPDLAPTFTSIQQSIFTATDSSGRAACTNCHTTAGGRVPPVGMDLGSGNAHAQLVNVPSRGKPGAVRVIPGDPDNSYLIHKLAAAVRGEPSQAYECRSARTVPDRRADTRDQAVDRARRSQQLRGTCELTIWLGSSANRADDRRHHPGGRPNAAAGRS